MGYVATGGAIQSTVRDEIFKNAVIQIYLIPNTATVEITFYKRTFDFEDVNTLILQYNSHINAANNTIKLDIGGVSKVNQSAADAYYRHSVDCSAISGNQELLLKITTANHVDNFIEYLTIVTLGA